MSAPNSLSLFLDRRFLPLMITQFMTAFNDNLFRAAIIALITYKLAAEAGVEAGVLNNMALALFMAPYFLFSAVAGEMADRFEKSGQIFWIKIWEVGLIILGALGFYLEDLTLLLVVLTGLGLQSTFFGPLKYGILPDLVKKEELLAANALIEAGTFLAILLGTSFGTLVVLSGPKDGNTAIAQSGLLAMAGFTLAVALIGAIASRFIHKTGESAPNLRVRKNIFASTTKLVRESWNQPVARHSIVLLSWIWTVGSIYLTQIPVLTKDYLMGSEEVITLFLAGFSVGVGVGSISTNTLLDGRISAKLIAPGLWALLFVSVGLYALAPTEPTNLEVSQLIGMETFMGDSGNLVILALLVIYAMAIGILMVPLYAILQDRSAEEERSQMIAANNIVNAIYMVVGAGVAAALIESGVETPMVLLIAGLVGMLFLPVVPKLTKALDSGA